MTTRILLLAVAVLGVTACARLSPAGGFGADAETSVTRSASDGTTLPDGRPLIAVLSALEVSPDTTGAAVVRATGVAPRQGYWNAALVPLPATEPDEARFAFVATPAGPGADGSPERSREISVATKIAPRDLTSIRRIVVVADQNARSVTR